jgi:Domain of unknown function (DUF927)
VRNTNVLYQKRGNIMSTKFDKISIISKIARIEDKATGIFGEQFEIHLSPDEVRQLTLPPSSVNDLRTLENALLDHGAVLPSDLQERKAKLDELAKSEAENQHVYEAQGGWLEPGKTFVLPDGAVSANTTNIIGVSPSFVVADSKGARKASGTPTSWRDGVGQLSRLSSIMMFTTSAAFAAPLLTMTGGESFGFCLYAPTRTGKSVATLVGASLIGIDDKNNLIDWNLTEAHLEQRLREYNDLLFPVDDLEAMHGKDREKYLQLRILAYRLSQGSSKGRHSSFTKAHEGSHGRWKCIALTSAEKSIQDMAALAKLERQPGECLRLIDVPALLPGTKDIFDRAGTPTKYFEDWRDTTFTKIATECRQNHGAALKAYLERIVLAEFDVAEFARNAALTFVGHVVESGDGAVARDVAAKFGLVYAGGMLGIKFGIVPWQADELLDAIAKCYRAARDILPDEGVALRKGMGVLSACLGRLRRLKELEGDRSTDWDRIDGYRARSKHRNRYVIKREAFNAIFATTVQQDLVLRHLIRGEQITLAMSNGGSGTTIKPKKQFIWPDGQRRRSYELTFPRD